MKRNNFFNNQSMMRNIYFENYNNQNFYYQTRNNIMNINPNNQNYIPYQICQNNNSMYNNSYIWSQNNSFNTNLNKFDSFYPKNYKNNSRLHKNKFISKNNPNYKLNQQRNEETSLEENEIEKTNNTSNANISLEDELNETKQENLKINDNDDNFEDNFTKIKKRGRRLSNISKASDFSKCSKSTTYTSTCQNNEKDVSEENNLAKNLKKDDFSNKEAKNDNQEGTEKYQGNPTFENTEILNVQVKISKDRTAVFKLKRYDDLFLTIKLFCEINSVDEKLIKPLIIKSLSALNTIYQVMNSQLDNQQINVLKTIKKI
jgi:hypothetical protein